MGLVLFVGWLAGIVAGLTVSALLVAGTLLLTRTHLSRRRHGWQSVGWGTALLVPLLWVAVHSHRWPAVRPGSDYDIAFRNLFFGGLAYAVAPGLAVVVVSLAVLALRRARPSSPPSASR